MKNKINMLFWWIILIIYLEIIYKFFILENVISLNTITVIVFSSSWAILLSLITSLFSNKLNRIINILLTFIITIVTLAQIVYYNFYNSIFSFFSLTAGGTGQVFQFYSIIIEVILRIWYIFLIILLPLLLALVFHDKLFNYCKINLKIVFKRLILLLISIIFIIISIFTDNSLYSLKRLLYETHAPLLTINKTGLMTMEVIDVYRYFFSLDEKIYIKDENNQNNYDIDNYNMLNIDFNSLIKNEKDSSVIKMHNYFKNINPTSKNEYTGLFKNKNIIFIVAESFDSIAIDERITPTLYKMANNSFVFNNYYQPLYPISTFDGEYSLLTSLVPKEGVWSLDIASYNYMPFTYGNMFKNNNYVTYGIHNNEYSFYHREHTHPSIGFNYLACGNGLEKLMNCDNWPNSDLEMISSTDNLYINEDNFAAYYMTFSGHLNYNFKENSMSIKNKDMVNDLPYSNKIKAYIAANIELDKALEKLIADLESNNKLDDTLIVISPDHYPYGLTNKSINEVSKINRNNKFETYHTSLIMYNPNIEKTIVDKTISGIDVLPTILNLFGLEYDSRLLMGRDIFSDEEHIVILSDRSWITDKCSYNSLTNKCTNGFKDKDYIDRINRIVNDRFAMSSLIIENDYYSKLGI